MTGNRLRLAGKILVPGISQINGLDDLCQGWPSKDKAKDFALKAKDYITGVSD